MPTCAECKREFHPAQVFTTGLKAYCYCAHCGAVNFLEEDDYEQFIEADRAVAARGFDESLH